MPRALFYTGVVFTLLAALMAGAQAWARWTAGIPVIGPEQSSPLRLFLMLLMIGPIGALCLRMCAFIFARDLYASLTGMTLTGAAMTAATGVLVVGLQMSLKPETSPALALFEWLGFYLLAFLCAVALLALHPYLRLRSPVGAALALMPGPLFIGMMAQDFSLLHFSSPVSAIYLASIASCLTAIGFHALRHRHTFIEPTDLRDMLDGRGTRANASSGEGFRIEHDAAFDG